MVSKNTSTSVSFGSREELASFVNEILECLPPENTDIISVSIMITTPERSEVYFANTVTA